MHHNAQRTFCIGSVLGVLRHAWPVATRAQTPKKSMMRVLLRCPKMVFANASWSGWARYLARRMWKRMSCARVRERVDGYVTYVRDTCIIPLSSVEERRPDENEFNDAGRGQTHLSRAATSANVVMNA